jgi:hypothetical protein
MTVKAGGECEVRVVVESACMDAPVPCLTKPSTLVPHNSGAGFAPVIGATSCSTLALSFVQLLCTT